MGNIYLIVEGDGEEKAAPLLVRNLLGRVNRHEFNIRPINAHGNGNITTPRGLERFLEYTRRRSDCAGVMVLLDTERDYAGCPPDLARHLGQRAQTLGLPFPVAIICASCEYESWFLYSQKIKEIYLKPGANYEGDPEKECSAREWLKRHLKSGYVYNETQDQPRMTAYLEIEDIIMLSRSFRRLANAVDELLEAIDENVATVTPIKKSTTN